jgi:hypothetical protein
MPAFLVLVLLCTAEIAAGFQISGTVKEDSVQIHARTSGDSSVTGVLNKGQRVTIDFVVNGADGQWCGIGTGYVACDALDWTPAPAPGPTPNSAASGKPDDSAISDVLELSGIRAVTSRAATHLDPRLARTQPLSSPELDALKRTIADTAEEEMQKCIAGKLRERYSARHMADLSQWMRSPLARKMADLDTQLTYAVMLPPDAADYSQFLQKNPPSQRRFALVQRLDSARQTSDSIGRMIAAMIRGAARETEAPRPGQKRMQQADVDKLVQRFRVEIQPAIQQASIMRSLYAFRAVKDNELEQFVRWNESPGGIWLAAAVNEGLSQAGYNIGQSAFQHVNELKRSKRLLF